MPDPEALKRNTLRSPSPESPSREGQPPHAQEHSPRSLAALWTVVFVAVIGHMPALASYFTQDDWSFLAKGAGIVAVEGWPARVVSNLLYWKLTWPLFGLNAAPYHGTALLLSAGLALMTVRLALRFGLSPAGAAVAGLVAAGTPVVVTPVFWVSATAELLAAVFVLIALDLWLVGGTTALGGATLAGLVALFSKESALALPLLLVLADVLLPGARIRSLPRGLAWGAVGLLTLAGGMAGLAVWNAIPHGSDMPYEISGLRTMLGNLPLLGSWLTSPWSFPSGQPIGARLAGGIVWIGWAVLAVLHGRRGRRLTLFAWIFALASIVPVLPLEHHLRPYYLLLAVPAWGWAVGCWVGPWLDKGLNALPTGRRGPVFTVMLLVTALATTILAWGATRSRLTARAADGLLVDAMASRMAVSARAARVVTSLRLPPRGALAVLQASRTEFPAELGSPEVLELIAVSPLHNALSGERGLKLLVSEGVDVAWVGHLDGLDHDDTVLLDAGDDDFRVLGPPRNARLYSALIAISAGQYARGRHDLWNVIGPEGARIEFAYDSDNLPIHPGDLDANARGFVEYLVEEDPSPSSGRILKLFEQLYEAVQGRELYGSPWGEMIRG